MNGGFIAAVSPAAIRRFGKILLAADLGPASQAATTEAFRLAAQLGAVVLIVNVIDPGALRRIGGRGPAFHQVRAEREAGMAELVAHGRAYGVQVSFLIWEGEPAEAIIEASLTESADLIVVGSRGHSGVGRALIGSVSDEVVRNASCPVLVVRRSTASG